MTITSSNVRIDVCKDDVEIKVSSNFHLVAMKDKGKLSHDVMPQIRIMITELPCYGESVDLTLSKAQAEILSKALQEKLDSWDKDYQYFLERIDD